MTSETQPAFTEQRMAEIERFTDVSVVPVVMKELCAEIRRLWYRERELLAANNVELEKRREAEKLAEQTLVTASGAQLMASKALLDLAEAHRSLEELRACEHERAMAVARHAEQQALPGAVPIYGVCAKCEKPVMFSEPHTQEGFKPITHWHTACYNAARTEEEAERAEARDRRGCP